MNLHNGLIDRAQLLLQSLLTQFNSHGKSA
jgi:hypothetical protein